MRNNTLLPVLFVAALVLASCSSNKKPPLKGERVSVLQYQDSAATDEEAQKVDIALAPEKENMAWPQQGGNAAHMPQNLALNAGTLKKAWDVSVGKGSKKDRKLITSPIAADDKVFTADTTGKISAFDIKKGKRVWQMDSLGDKGDEATVSPGLGYKDGALYVADGIGHVMALNAKDGKKIWSQAIDQPVRGSPTIHDNRVVVVTLNDETIAMNAQDGAILWRHEGVQEPAGFLGAPSPAIDGNVVVTAYSSGDVVALRAETGQEAWSDNLAGVAESQSRAVTQLAGFRGHPVLDQDVVFVGNTANRVIAVHVPSGERIWQKEFGLVATPWVSGNMIFAITSQNEMVALIKETGQIRWTLPLPHFEDPKDMEDVIFWNGPVLGGGRLFLTGSNNKLLEIAPDSGKILRETQLSDVVMVSPVIVQKTLLILNDDGELAAYR